MSVKSSIHVKHGNDLEQSSRVHGTWSASIARANYFYIPKRAHALPPPPVSRPYPPPRPPARRPMSLSLRQLSVIACKLDSETLVPIADVAATAEKLQDLDLSWNPIRW